MKLFVELFLIFDEDIKFLLKDVVGHTILNWNDKAIFLFDKAMVNLVQIAIFLILDI